MNNASTALDKGTKHAKKSNISRQILNVFVIQMLFISGITILGVIIAATVVEGVMMKKALEGEAQHFWSMRAQNPAHPIPNTDNLYAYLIEGENQASLPAPLHNAKVGLQRIHLDNSEPLIYVDQNDTQTLYLIFDEQSVAGLSFYFGVVPLSVALIILYISAWFAYRKSQQAVSPLIHLANLLRDFDIEKDDLDTLSLDELSHNAGNDEVNILIQSLDAFTNKITQLVTRERNFTRDASHELRTPLTIIQGASQWLHKQPLNTRQQENVERIMRTSSDMSFIVNALLLLARGQFAHNPDIGKQAVNINQMVSNLIADLQTSHNQDHAIQVDFVASQTLIVFANRDALQIVVSNLLRNAFNYSLDGMIHIFIRDNALYLQNRIKRTYHEDDLHKLFEPFVRGDAQKQNDQSDGHGIGLDIVKRLCDSCAWQIEAHYAKQNGIEFALHFAPNDIQPQPATTPT